MVSGSGPDGQVRAQDVLSFTPSAAPLAAPAVPGAAFTDIPLSNVRQVGNQTQQIHDVFVGEGGGGGDPKFKF